MNPILSAAVLFDKDRMELLAVALVGVLFFLMGMFDFGPVFRIRQMRLFLSLFGREGARICLAMIGAGLVCFAVWVWLAKFG